MQAEHRRPSGRQGWEFLAGGGEMGARIRAFDWASTPLGPVESWPRSLRSAVGILLASKAQISLFWGPELITLYNDAYRPVFGGKHPRALGLPIREAWDELWRTGLEELFAGVLATGEAYRAGDRPFPLERHGFVEETYFDVSYDPVRDEGGRVGGVLCIVSETTGRVIGERRLRTQREMGRAAEARSAAEVARLAAGALSANPADVPFALLYLADPDGRTATLAGSAGLRADPSAVPASVPLDGSGPWGLAAGGDGAAERRVRVVQAAPSFAADGVRSHLGDPVAEALVLPLARPGHAVPRGFLVAGLNPHRPADEDYLAFLRLLGGQVSAALSAALAFEEEKRRAEALAEIDRAKTEFFSNVSHEFRTPLTLMLGPLEEALAEADGPGGPLPPRKRELVETARRNALRLLRLVNTLLDFSRVEAGRAQARFEPTDLAALTAELASVFRSAVESAGLTLTVDCPPLPGPVWVDRDQWEKIVLNLLSNALKHTFEGGISIALRAAAGPDGERKRVELTVADTGVGIPADELPRLFERFHRVRGARSRSHEGTGIGLSLVRELAALHGGTVAVESRVGRGTAFTVTLPAGDAHLPADRLGPPSSQASTAIRAEAFVEEARRWLPAAETQPSAETQRPAAGHPEAEGGAGGGALRGARVLLADDNADMRAYVRRLLEAAGCRVRAVADGAAALEAVRAGAPGAADAPGDADVPDAVLADVMMPGLDGFGLLRALRSDPATAALPVILLSARAGEASRVEGLAAGADDYLVKPFGARELLARVEAALRLARVRRESAERERTLREDAAAAREREFKTLVENNPDIISRLDRAGRHLYVSPSVEPACGLKPEAFLGKTNRDLGMPPEFCDLVERTVASVVSEGRPARNDYSFPSPDGPRHYQSTLVPEFGPDGSVATILGIVRDVTDLKRAQEALAAREREYKTLVENNPDIIVRFDRARRHLYVSPSIRPVTGRTQEQFVGRTNRELGMPEEHCRLWEGSVDAAFAGRTVEFGFAFPSPGGTRWFQSRLVPEYAADGSVVTVLGITRDVTDLKRAERTAAERAEELETLLDLLPVGVYIAHDPECRRVTGNRAALAQARARPGDNLSLSAPQAEIVPRRCRRDGRDLGSADLPMQRAASAGEAVGPEEYEYVFGDGTVRPLYGGAAPLFGRDGRVRGCVGVFMDRTERRRSEEALRRSAELLSAIGEAAPGFLWVRGEDGRIEYINRHWSEYAGIPVPALPADLPTADPVHSEDRDGFVSAARRAIETRSPFQWEFRYRRADGAHRWFYGRSLPVPGSGRRVGFTIDIDDRKRAEEELRAAKEAAESARAAAESAREAAEAANRSKDEFLSVLSHELRTPLTAMVGWMQLLRSGLLGPDETRSALDTVARNLTAQTRLVEEVLDVSRIITGKMALDTAPVALADVVRAALEVARPAAAAKGLRIETAVDPSVPPVEGDADRLRQVVWNLVGNAVKFTPSGGLVRVSLGAGPGRAVLTVADTGEGIPADFLPYVFDRFRQADAGKSRRHGGLGLGLSLVRHLVELHGGTAAAESAGPGKGATFTVVLPTAAATATAVMATSASASATASVDSPHLPPPPASAMALRRSAEAASVPSGPSGRPPPSPPPPARPVTDGADMSGVRVLVVEDTPDSREMLAAMLRMAGAEVHTAADADEAMAAMQDGVGVPDVLVSDIGLPGRDGFSLIAELRSRPGRAAGVPAVALTGYASGEDRRRCLKAGFQEHVAKPVEPRRLFDAVVAALNGRGRSRSQTKGDEG